MAGPFFSPLHLLLLSPSTLLSLLLKISNASIASSDSLINGSETEPYPHPNLLPPPNAQPQISPLPHGFHPPLRFQVSPSLRSPSSQTTLPFFTSFLFFHKLKITHLPLFNSILNSIYHFDLPFCYFIIIIIITVLFLVFLALSLSLSLS